MKLLRRLGVLPFAVLLAAFGSAFGAAQEPKGTLIFAVDWFFARAVLRIFET